jgi:tetratricopeptide (TPR) repeat protein
MPRINVNSSRISLQALCLLIVFVLLVVRMPFMRRYIIASSNLYQILRSGKDIAQICQLGQAEHVIESENLVSPKIQLLALTSTSHLDSAMYYELLFDIRKDHSAMYLAGKHYEACGYYNAQIDAWRHVWNIDAFLLERHRESIRKNESQQAVAPLLMLIQLFPHDISYYMRLGMLYKSINDFDDSIRSFEKVLHLEPDNAFALYELGLLYKQSGQTEKALEMLSRAVANPSLGSKRAYYAYQSLAMSYWRKGHLPEACLFLHQAANHAEKVDLYLPVSVCNLVWHQSVCSTRTKQAIQSVCDIWNKESR